MSEIDDALRGIREAVDRQLGMDRIEAPDVDPASLVRFSPDLPEELAPGRRAELLARAEELQPWLQGPFLLGGDLVIGGAWRNDQRWVNLGPELPDLSGKRVLDVGSNAGYDPFMFKRRGAAEVVACEPFDFIEQARFLESVYGTGVDFRKIGWQDLDAAEMGGFDLVHCHGVLYHELEPIAMLRRLREVTAPGGTLLLGSMMLASPELSEHARFVAGAYYGDPTWWWVPGRLCLRWMIEACGFDVDREFGRSEGPRGEFPTINGYFKASPSERPPART